MTAPAYDISFCIPTYNFGAFIAQTLESIIEQADNRVQIVIIDGGSTDDTATIIAQKMQDFPQIKLITREKRVGVDRDILESVAQADGDYCWLFSADDILAPGAIAALRETFREPWDVTFTAFTQCDLDMKPLRPGPVMNSTAPQTFDWRSLADRVRHGRLAAGTPAFFSFISVIIVRRAAWMQTPVQERFVGSCWIIAAHLFAAAARSLVVRYEPRPLVLRRGDNDSFLAMGLVKRWGLGIHGFREVAEHYFGRGSVEARAVGRALQCEFGVPDMLMCKIRLAQTGSPDDVAAFNTLVRRHYDHGPRDFILRHFIADLPPRCLIVLYKLYRLALRLRGAPGAPR